MSEKTSVYLERDGISVCADCALELNLGCVEDSEDVLQWSVFTGKKLRVQTQNADKRYERVVVQKFREGDHILDYDSDSPGVVKEVLPQGLYSVQPDGEPPNMLTTLKDREMLFADAEILPAVVNDRFHVGDKILVYSAFGVNSEQTGAKGGEIVSINTAEGVLSAKLETGETIEIRPDMDLFQVYHDEEIQAISEDEYLENLINNEYEISF